MTIADQLKRTFFAVPMLLYIVLSAGTALHAQVQSPTNDHVSWDILTPSVSGRPGEIVDVRVRMNVVRIAHIYSTTTFPDSMLGPSPLKFSAGGDDLLSIDSDIAFDIAPKRHYDENFELTVETWSGRSVVVTIPVRISRDASDGLHDGWVEARFMTCTDTFCRPPSAVRLDLTVDVKS